MSLEAQLAAAENQLESTADSLGDLLEQIGDRISPALLGDRHRQTLFERARAIPSTVAAFPFGFEFPLHDSEPKADLGISLVGGTRSAAYFERRGQAKNAGGFEVGLAWLLDDTHSEGAFIRRLTGRKMMLEYDIGSAPAGDIQDPGLFLRSARQPLSGGERQAREVAAMLDAVVKAVGWKPEPGEHQHIARVHGALEEDARVESLGAFPARTRRIRLAVSGLRNIENTLSFLARTGGPVHCAASTIGPFEARQAFVDLSVHFDVHPHGLGPTLGLGFAAKERIANDPRYWIDPPQQWNPFLCCLRESQLGVPDKLSALETWPSKPELLICQGGTLILIRGIHHVKFLLRNHRVEAIKAYVFFLLCPWPIGSAGAARRRH